MPQKVPKQYDSVVFQRIIADLEKRIETLSQVKLKRIKSVAADAAQNLQVNEPGYVLDDTGQFFDFVVRGEDSRLYRISGQASEVSASSSSGGTTDHGSLSGLADDDHTQYLLRSVLTTKGDIFVRTSSAITRQAVGADNKPLVAEAAQTNGLRYGGKILVDEAEIDGDLNHDGSNIGVFGVTPVARASALVQTYSTADRTLSSYTPDSESSAYSGIDNLQLGTPYAQLTDLNALRVAYENLRAFTEDLAGFVNSLVDDLQSYGLEQ